MTSTPVRAGEPMEKSQDKPSITFAPAQRGGAGDEHAPNPNKRRPYTPPRIEESGSFEHLVLSCAFAVSPPTLNCTRGGTRSTR